MSEVLRSKVLLAVAGASLCDGGEGALASEVLARFTAKRRAKASREEASAAIEALLASGEVEEVTRGRGARGLRLSAAGRARCLALRFDGPALRNARFTGKQVEEALAALRVEVARSSRAAEPTTRRPAESAEGRPLSPPAAPPGAGSGAAATPAPRAARPPEELSGAVLAALDALLARDHPAGDLVPIHALRDAVAAPGEPSSAFDQALWGLARARALTLLKRNDEAAMTDAERARSFFHPATGGLLFYARRERP